MLDITEDNALLLSALLGLALVATEPEVVGPATGARYGRIIVRGNTDTPDRHVLRHAPFVPDQSMKPGEVSRAREALRRSRFFRTDAGHGPHVRVLPNDFDSAYLDVLITVEEKAGNWLVFGVIESLEAGLAGELARLIRRAIEEVSRPR